MSLQGNLEPSALFADEAQLRQIARNMVDSFGTQSYICNLGHGMLPYHDPQSVAILVDEIHKYSEQVNLERHQKKGGKWGWEALRRRAWLSRNRNTAVITAAVDRTVAAVTETVRVKGRSIRNVNATVRRRRRRHRPTAMRRRRKAAATVVVVVGRRRSTAAVAVAVAVAVTVAVRSSDDHGSRRRCHSKGRGQS